MRRAIVALSLIIGLAAMSLLRRLPRVVAPMGRCHGVVLGETRAKAPAGTPLAAASTRLPGAFADEAVDSRRPMGLAWGDGVLYVAEADRGVIARYRSDGSPLTSWTGFAKPVAVATAGDTVYVADFIADRVTKLTSAGVPVAKWGRRGHGPGEFDAPSGLAVDQHGDVYVTDFYNHRVQKFSSEGRFLLEWGGKGRRQGRFRYPAGLALGPAGDVLVADAYNNRVQKFTMDGRVVGEWGGMGFGFGGARPGWFRLAKDVAVDAKGDVYVADAFNRRVQKFSADGTVLAIWPDNNGGASTIRYPSALAVGPNGQLYVGDFFTGQLWTVECR
ncbi:MAG: SBBP repeat-containing protein [Gemmatimonadaceae bacterium]